MRLGRRGLMLGALTTALDAVLPPGSPATDSLALERAIGALFSDQCAARLAGDHYLRAHAQEADREVLHTLLFGAAPAPTAAALRRGIVERRRADFAREDTVLVAGWVLARSEARLCALVSLLPAAA